MQNIPVRFFDKAAKVMLYPEQAIANGIFLSAHGEAVQWQGTEFKRLANIVVMHRTPHMDDGKTYIWEGDICDLMVPNAFGSQSPARGFMHMDAQLDKWNIEIVNPKNPLNEGLHMPTMCRTVGNIYEHPMLLKQAPILTVPPEKPHDTKRTK